MDLSCIRAPAILDSLADGVYITDIERRILFWNRAAERITGWAPQDVVGRSCYDDILGHIDTDGHPLCGEEYCPLHRSIVTGKSSTEPLLVFARGKQGRRIPVQVSVAPVQDEAGRLVGGIEVFHDLTATFEDLQRAKVIQQHSVACQLPPDPRVTIATLYTPSSVVGGDFFRIEPKDPNWGRIYT